MFIASVINAVSPDQHRIGAAVGMVLIAVVCAFGAGYALRDLQAHDARQADHHSD